VFDVAAVERALAGTRFARLHYTQRTGSTNDDAARLLGSDGAAGLVLVTGFQEAGRGRHARRWIAPPGSSLLFTAILPEALHSNALWAVPFWAALCVADGLRDAAVLDVRLQWPNDILAAGRKCCGILATSRVQGDHAWAACGIGVNVARPAGDALAAIEPAPAYLSDFRADVTPEDALIAILRAADRRWPALATPDAVAREWEIRAQLDGTPYRILVDGESGPFDAVARSLGPDGSLIVESGGVTREIALADARVLR
jgi:BirA family biotin operon repressor/biotin-[acetyl-CoA-carboxylase] ligase